MLGSFFLILFGLAASRDRCKNMMDKECQRVASEVFNYSVPEIRRMTTVMRKITENRVACKIEGECPLKISSSSSALCNNGIAQGSGMNWACDNIDLLAFIPLSQLGSSPNADGNDIWGWTDPDGNQYVFTGQTDGTSIVDVTKPTSPEVLCFIPSRVSTLTIWRDIKVITNKDGVAFIVVVADRSRQGAQWIPILESVQKCRASTSRPYVLQENVDFGWTGTIGYGTVTSSNTHNIVGFDNFGSQRYSIGDTVYLVGSSAGRGGLIALNFDDVSPTDFTKVPRQSGGYSDDGYSHDAQCGTYTGPDADHSGKTICFGYNENTLTIVDVTNPAAPKPISRTGYSTAAYTHQGWLTSDQRYLLMNDELDEMYGRVPRQTTYVVDVTDLDKPIIKEWISSDATIDHNLYIKNFGGVDYVFETNYKKGLVVLSLEDIESGVLKPTGYFKTWLYAMDVEFDGAWSNYPYFNDKNYPGLVVVQDINTGLYVLDACKAIPQCA